MHGNEYCFLFFTLTRLFAVKSTEIKITWLIWKKPPTQRQTENSENLVQTRRSHSKNAVKQHCSKSR